MAQALSSASALGDWRLLFIPTRPRGRRDRGRRESRRQDTISRSPTAPSACTFRSKQPTAAGDPAAPPSQSLVKDYKGGKPWPRARRSTRRRPTSTPGTKIVEVDGMKAGLLPKKNRGETVSLVLTLHYGNEESLKGQTTAAGMLPWLMMAGTKKHDRQALREEMDALGIRISSGGGLVGGRGGRGGGGGGGTLGQLTFSVEAKRSTLPQAIELLGEILREPAFPAAEFDTMKRRARAGSQMMRTEPSALACNRLVAALSPYSPSDVRYVPTAEESEKRLEPSRSHRSSPCTRSNSALRLGSWASSAISIPNRRWHKSARCSRTGSPTCR